MKQEKEWVTLEEGVEANLQEFLKLPLEEQQRQNKEAVAWAEAYLKAHPPKDR
jgi:hypothetical protein